MTTTILFFEPRPLVRIGQQHPLSHASLPGDFVVLDACPAKQAHPFFCKADLLVFSILGDYLEGLRTLVEVCEKLEPMRVLLLADLIGTSCKADEHFPESVRGLLPTNSSLGTIESAIRLILANGECFPANIAQRLESGSLFSEVGSIEPDGVRLPTGQSSPTPKADIETGPPRTRGLPD